MSPVEMRQTPSRSHCNWACVPLPDPGAPSRTTRAGWPSTPSPTNPASLHEAFVVAHHELALDLLDGVHADAHHDEQRRATEVELDPHALGDPPRQHGGELRREPRQVDAGE